MINSFKGEFDFLSNFYDFPMHYRGLNFPTAEHAFQAAKAKYSVDVLWVQQASTPGIAKRRGRQVDIRPDWETSKNSVMRAILFNKFSHTALAEKLLATKDEELVEGNYWHDNYWGICFCNSCSNGQNHLGKLLMQTRKLIR